MRPEHTLDEALAMLYDHPHLWRFRELCHDESDRERRDAYRALVVNLASGRPLSEAAPTILPTIQSGPSRPCCG